MKLFIEESTLTDIGNAIRDKGGTTELIPVPDLAMTIRNLPTGGGGGDVEPLVLTGDCQYGCSGDMSATYINLFANTISTVDLTNSYYMFYKSPLERIPFTINFKLNTNAIASNMFSGCENLKEIPAMTNMRPYNISGMFQDCYSIREFSENFGEDWDWSYYESSPGQYGASQNGMLSNCRSLRKLPLGIFRHGNPNVYYSYSIYASLSNLNSLDEIVDFPFPHLQSIWTSNALSSFLGDAYRVKRLTFALQDDGSPYAVSWKNQTLDLTKNLGSALSYTTSNILNYNSGITADKEVKDDATYQALKNDPDWFTVDINYSRYNHDSAVETINSLPDTSAYLASAGGSNTIKFKGAAGALTDGGAINTLTEEEIAVAAAKGWTVTLA